MDYMFFYINASTTIKTTFILGLTNNNNVKGDLSNPLLKRERVSESRGEKNTL